MPICGLATDWVVRVATRCLVGLAETVVRLPDCRSSCTPRRPDGICVPRMSPPDWRTAGQRDLP